MAGNYPPGVNAGTSNAPWNEEPAPECKECGGTYSEGGHKMVEREIDGHVTEEPCPNSGMDARDYEEAKRVESAEMKMDQRRLEERKSE